MSHWLFEAGIGEARAALVSDGRIRIAAIEPEGTMTVGSVLAGRIARAGPRGTAIVAAGAAEMTLAAIPAGLSVGRRLHVAVVREAMPERGRVKLARVVPVGAPADATDTPGPDLLARITATGLPVLRPAAHEPDALEAAGWSERLEEAVGAPLAFPGGALLIAATPAMTVIDVDGGLAPEALAIAAAAAAGAAIECFGIGGSIGIDFPTVAGKAARGAIAAALDAGLAAARIEEYSAPVGERTAVNGFGFLQIVRPRPRPSLPDRLVADPIGATARALLRRLEREPPGGPDTHPVVPAVLRYLDARPHWQSELARRTGRVHRLVAR